MATEVVVSVLPMCDIHQYVLQLPPVLAAYDGATTAGSWANMCEACFAQYGLGLGTGVGQKLILRATK
jgi:hypothetical protein